MGLLAVFLALLFKYDKLFYQLGTEKFDIIPIIKISIVTWTAYCSMEIVGYSDDVIGNTISQIVRKMAPAFLLINFLYTGIVFCLFFTIGYYERIFWIYSLILFFGIIILINVFIEFKEKKDENLSQLFKKQIMNIDKERLSFMFFILFTFCVMFTPLQYISLFWALAILMLFFMILAYLNKKKN